MSAKSYTKRLRILLATGVAAATMAAPCAKAASPSEEARIGELEAEVKALAAEVRTLKAAQASAPIATAPAPPTTAAAPGSAPGAPEATVASAPPSGAEAGTPTTAAIASITGGKPTIASSDGRFTANLHAVMQFDAADYLQQAAGPIAADLRRGAASGDTAHARQLASGADFRRARLGLDGKAFGDFEYSALLEFGGAGEEDAGHIQELWVQYSGIRPFHLRVGAFPPFIGLEDAGSSNAMPFLERPASADIARNLAGGDYREAVQLTANSLRWFASGAVTGRLVGVVNSSGSGVAQSYDSQLGFVGRVAAIPLQGEDWRLHVGAHRSYVARPADAGGPDAAANVARYAIELRERPELRVDGTRLIDTGAIDAKSASTAGGELAAQWRNLWLQGEYERFEVDRRAHGLSNPNFQGWYVEGSWILTGEQRRYNTGNFAFDGPPVAHNFSPKDGTWGAFELAARLSDIDLNYDAGAHGTAPKPDAVRGGDQQIVTGGLNWYLNPVVRLMLQYQHVDIRRLSPDAAAFKTPAGAEVGQTYQTVSVRSQLAF